MRTAIVVADTHKDVASTRSETLVQAGHYVRTAFSSDALLYAIQVAPADITLVSAPILRAKAGETLASSTLRPRFGVVSVLMRPTPPSETLDALELCDVTAPYDLTTSELLRLVSILLGRKGYHNTIQENLAHYCTTHRLSPRERSVLEHATFGASNDEIAATLGCARPTVSTYWNRIFEKTNKRTYREVIAHLIQHCDAIRGYAPRAHRTPKPAESGVFLTNEQAPNETFLHTRPPKVC